MSFGKAAQRLNRAIYPLSRVLNGVGLVFLAVMMFLTAADVVLRYVFNRPIIGSYELTEFIMAVVVAFGLAYTQVKKGHINVDVAISKLSPRVQSVINSITYTFFLGFFALISWRLILYADRLRVDGFTTGTLFVPIFPFVLLVAIGSISLCLIVITNLLEYLAQVVEGKRWREWCGLLFIIVLIVTLFSIPLWGQEFIFKLSPLHAGIAGTVLLVIILFSGMPVGIVMGFLGFLCIAYIGGIDPAFTRLGTSPYTTVSSYGMTVVPLFVLMGAFAFHTGMTQELFNTAYKWLGRLPGGLAVATIGASALFSAVSGSSVAATATIGMVALPEMRRYKYDDALSTGSICAGGGLDIMIPPSIILVIYGILTEQSIGKLLLAGVIPGIVLSLLYMAVILFMCIRNPNLGPRGEKTTFIEKILSLKNTWAVLVLFLVVMGGLYLGVFTPTEAAGIGAFGAFVVGLARRKLKWKGFVSSLQETIETTAMCFVILIGANIFGYFLAISRLPNELSAIILNLEVDRNIIMFIILIIYLFLGCIISSLAMIVLTVPIFFPVIVALGFDPIWFGIIIVLVVEMGLITPPVGMNVYIIHGIAKTIPMYTIFRGIVPFLLMEFVLAALLMIWPQIATLLPDMMK
jgi:C4-dicarboxylate transporter DctM subunit